LFRDEFGFLDENISGHGRIILGTGSYGYRKNIVPDSTEDLFALTRLVGGANHCFVSNGAQWISALPALRLV
jgi:hypothetical protein